MDLERLRPRRPSRRRLLLIVVAGLAVLGLAVLVPWAILQLDTRGARFAVDDAVPPAPVALVLGAGLNPDGSPTGFLAERVAVGAELYRRGVVKALLMSGDTGAADHDEVTAMGRAAQALGVPQQAIVLDYAGFDTYSSCYRAKNVFGLSRVIVVSQPFHLARAVWLCSHLGIATVGAGTAQDGVPQTTVGQLREVPAAAKAILDVVRGRLPTFTGPPDHRLDPVQDGAPGG